MISFAAPMPLGMTSEGEYFDGEFESVTTTEDMMARLNATMPPEIQVLDIIELPDDAKPSMAIVTASDYYIYKNEECENDTMPELLQALSAFAEKDKVEIVKKTKSKEELTDIRPLIYKIKEYKDGIYMLLASGSRDNLKPELVVEAMCEAAGVPFNRYDYRIHRLETYMGEKEDLQPLSASGTRF